MKILTKDWADMYARARFISSLQEIQQETKCNELKVLCKENFLTLLKQDGDMKKYLSNKALVEKLFCEKLKRNLNTIKTFSVSVLGELEKPEFLEYGFACKKDKVVLDNYQKLLIKQIESDCERARINNERACKYLSKPFEIEEVVGELVYDEYSKGKNYYLEIGGRVLCVKNYKILQRDEFKINYFDEDDALTKWTCVKAVELYFDKENGFTIHLLILNGDEYENTEDVYFTLSGTDISLI